MRKVKIKPPLRKLNWNVKVNVKLTDYGKDIYFHQFDQRIENGEQIERYYPYEGDDGYSIFTLWKFMELYGKYIHRSSKPIVEDLSFYIPETELEVVDV